MGRACISIARPDGSSPSDVPPCGFDSRALAATASALEHLSAHRPLSNSLSPSRIVDNSRRCLRAELTKNVRVRSGDARQLAPTHRITALDLGFGLAQRVQYTA